MGSCGSKTNAVEVPVDVVKSSTSAVSTTANNSVQQQPKPASVSQKSSTSTTLKKSIPQPQESAPPRKKSERKPSAASAKAETTKNNTNQPTESSPPKDQPETPPDVAPETIEASTTQQPASSLSVSSSAPSPPTEDVLQPLLPPQPSSLSREHTSDSQFSTSLRPSHESNYFETQCRLYFQSWTALQQSKKTLPNQVVNLSPDVVRWEWASRDNDNDSQEGTLTGRDRDTFVAMDILTAAVAPVEIQSFQFAFAHEQPFGRCRVQLRQPSTGETRRLYVEFTFNEEGQIIFVESWPIDNDNNSDIGNNRLSTQIPGLGSPTSVIHMAQLKEIAKVSANNLEILRKELDRPLKIWFERALLQRLEAVVLPSQRDNVLTTFRQKKKIMEKAGRAQHVELLFPSEDDDQWARTSYMVSLGGAVEFASAAVRTVVFSAQT